MKRVGIILMLCILSVSAVAQETEMTYEEYEMALAAAQERETTAREQIAQVQAEIESLKQQLSEVDAQIAQAIQDKYDILGITEQDVIDAENEIASIRQELELLLSLSPEELENRISDIEKLEARIASLKAKPVSYLWRIRDQINEIESLLQRVRANLPDKPSQYTVQLIPGNRDCLYRISGYDFVYGDATQWPRIYRANQTQINGAYQQYVRRVETPMYEQPEDLIFPGQVFDIPR